MESLLSDKLLGDIDGAREAADWAARYGRGLYRFVTLRGFWAEGRILLAAAVIAAQQLGDEAQESALLYNHARLVADAGDLGTARSLYKRGLEIDRKRKDRSGIANKLHALGYTYALDGEIKQARYYYEQSLEIKRQIHNIKGAARSLHQLARLDIQENEMVQARQRFEEALQLQRQIKYTWGVAWTLVSLGEMERNAGNITQARAYYEESLALFQELGDALGEANVKLNFGGLLCDEGAWAEGLTMLHAAVATYTRLEMPRELGLAKDTLAQYEQQAPPGVADTGA